MSFQGQVVLVTGASSGIGAAIAILFAKEGANVAMVGRNQAKLDKVAKQCAKPPLVLNADITIEAEGKRIVEDTVKKYGKLDVLVNNAGMTRYGSTIMNGKMLKTYDDIMNVNVRSVINITSVAAPHLAKTKGNIINISSIASTNVPALSERLPYCMSKSSLDHFTKGVAVELAAYGIRVNSVNPGPVYTDFLENAGVTAFSYDAFKESTPLKRISEPQEVADIVAFLASDKAKGVTGAIYLVDNGLALSKF